VRVKLSYTVEEEDVLAEAAKIINLAADDMQQAISLFNDVQEELKGTNDDNGIVNVNRAFEMLDEYRKSLFRMDTRIGEVVEIVKGYDEYQRTAQFPSPAEAPLEDLLHTQGALEEMLEGVNPE
jgi:hypothetical protein